MLRRGRQPVDEAHVEAVVESLHADWLTNAPDLACIEDVIAEPAGVPHAVSVTSGTVALHVAYYTAAIESCERVVSTPLTVAASAGGATPHGATIGFADIQAGKEKDLAAAGAQVTDRARVTVGIDCACLPIYAPAFAAPTMEHGSASPQTAATRTSSPRTYKALASKSTMCACTGTKSWTALGYKRGMFPNTVEYYRSELSLPMFPGLKQSVK